MSKKLIQAAAGAGGESVYVEDVFSTYLYEGRSGASGLRTIDNGINLQDEGGLIWTRERDNAAEHLLIDTERGLSGGYLATDATSAANTLRVNESIDSFTTSGYKLDGGGTLWDRSTYKYCSWTFRKQAGFFDVVTYTGNGTAGRTVSHSLGSAPGCIIVKRTDSANGWALYHRAMDSTAPEDWMLRLNSTAARADLTPSRWNDTAPTSTQFTLSDNDEVNGSGATYVAYLFAHDDQSFGDNSNESIIKCGSYTGNATAGNFVNLGWEPQYVLIKNANSASQWWIHDIMRGLVVGGVDNRIRPDTTDAENTFLDAFWIAPDGFYVRPTGTDYGKSGDTFIYIAIRKPMKTPEAGTEVFNVNYNGSTGDGNVPAHRTTFPVDMFFWKDVNNSGSDIDWFLFDRLRGMSGKALHTNTTDAEGADPYPASWEGFDLMDGVIKNTSSYTDYYAWMFKRATGFFDVVAYTGTGSTTTVNHNLGVVPELIIAKKRLVTTSGSDTSWPVYVESLGTGTNSGMYLNSSDGAIKSNTTRFSATPTSSVFTVGTDGDVNKTSEPYIAYLFATLAGVSKVGSYTGTGTTNNIDCGFSSSARFVMVKRTSSTGDWFVWDSARGITTGLDPFLKLNTTDAEGTPGSNIIEPYSSGFTLTNNAGTTINGSGSSFIFLAIA